MTLARSSSALGARAPSSRSPAAQLERLGRVQLPTFADRVRDAAGEPLTALRPSILQLNLGKKCNQTCRHCHVDAGPDRREVMEDDVLEAALGFLERAQVSVLDLTGGAPELHPRFREIVRRARSLGAHVMDRCNLTILRAPSYRDLPNFFAEHAVEVVASLPWYTASRTDTQRGDGVFESSLEAIRALNAIGYGMPESGRTLTLVTNPVGTYLSPPQAALERDWHRELARLHGVHFTRLFTIQNMPISRFLDVLEEKGQLESYLERLAAAFNPAALEGLMCRSTLSVSHDGRLYDCDFNQMLDLSIGHIRDVDAVVSVARTVRTDQHCFGCSAGGGSSCGGALA